MGHCKQPNIFIIGSPKEGGKDEPGEGNPKRHLKKYNIFQNLMKIITHRSEKLNEPKH